MSAHDTRKRPGASKSMPVKWIGKLKPGVLRLDEMDRIKHLALIDEEIEEAERDLIREVGDA